MNNILSTEVPTIWHIIGICGFLIFTSRWLLQTLESRKAKNSILTARFWYVSLTGSLLLLLYFTFGRGDYIGVLTNVFPLFLAIYNIHLIKKNRTKSP